MIDQKQPLDQLPKEIKSVFGTERVQYLKIADFKKKLCLFISCYFRVVVSAEELESFARKPG